MHQKLFIFYCGGRAKGARLEIHDIIIAVGPDPKACYDQLKSKWFGDKAKLHIDGFIEVDGVDGYRVEIKESSGTDFTDNGGGIEESKKLYFINLGGTIPGNLYEHHEPILLVAGSNMGAMSRARSLSKGGYEDKHVDNILDVDDIISINEEFYEYSILLIPDIDFINYHPNVENVYWFVK